MKDNAAIRNKLRQDMTNQREKLSSEEVDKFSNTIIHRLADLEPVREAQTIMCFSNIKNEINLQPLLEEYKKTMTILLPRVCEDGIMEAIAYTDRDHTRPGPFGIMEPEGEPYPADQIDVILVPGLVFDYKGFRLGYGRGYYDRFLTRLRKEAFICGLCYDFQVVKNVFPHQQDVPVHWIVTEKSELVLNWDFF